MYYLRKFELVSVSPKSGSFFRGIFKFPNFQQRYTMVSTEASTFWSYLNRPQSHFIQFMDVCFILYCCCSVVCFALLFISFLFLFLLLHVCFVWLVGWGGFLARFPANFFWHIEMWNSKLKWKHESKKNDWRAANNGKTFAKCVVISPHSCRLVFVMQIFNHTPFLLVPFRWKTTTCQEKFIWAAVQSQFLFFHSPSPLLSAPSTSTCGAVCILIRSIKTEMNINIENSY